MQVHSGQLRFSPTDLNGFLSCEHLTKLQLAVARGELKKPFRPNLHADLIKRKGEKHEADYLARLRADGRGIVEVSFDDRDWTRVAAETDRAIQDGADVVYQAVLTDGTWRGFADFIERLPDGSGYEVVDTKLARLARPQHVLQLCFYTEQLARIQGRWPAAMHVVTGTSERESFRPDDFMAYYRRLRQRFLDAVERRRPTYPYPSTSVGSANSSRSTRSAGPRTTTSRLSPASPGFSSSGSRPPGSERSRRSPRPTRPPRSRACARPPSRASTCRPGSSSTTAAPGSTRSSTSRSSPTAVSRCSPSRARATSGST